jgi:hypothetical protein
MEVDHWSSATMNSGYSAILKYIVVTAKNLILCRAK